MSEFDTMTTTAVYIKRNSFRRELYLNGESNSDTHNKRLQKQIDEHQAEIDRREREGE
jgi:mevalonate pyrophosphate decarboxylase